MTGHDNDGNSCDFSVYRVKIYCNNYFINFAKYLLNVSEFIPNDCSINMSSIFNNKFSLLTARDSEERERWIRALEDTIKRHSQARKVCNE